jgi:hypothetical protein
MRAFPDPPVFDRAQLRRLGWSDSAITRAVRSGRLMAVRRGQLTVVRPLNWPPEDDPWRTEAANLVLAARAATRARADAVISHHAAALLHDLPLLRRPPAIPRLTVNPRTSDRGVGAHIHRARVDPDDVVIRDGTRLTSIARTLVDLARLESTRAAVVSLDAALHRHLVTSDELDAIVAGCRNWPGIAQAVRAIRLADARSESPLESVSRLELRRLALPVPVLQPDIRTVSGALVRPDFYWDELGVAGEADGAGKYGSSPTSLLDEKRRQEDLDDSGVVVTRWGWDEVRDPPALLRRITRAFARANARSGSGFHREWSVAGRPGEQMG